MTDDEPKAKRVKREEAVDAHASALRKYVTRLM